MATLDFLKEEIQTLKKEERFIEPAILQSEQGPVCQINGKEVVPIIVLTAAVPIPYFLVASTAASFTFGWLAKQR